MKILFFYVDNVDNSVDNSVFPFLRHFSMWITFWDYSQNMDVFSAPHIKFVHFAKRFFLTCFCEICVSENYGKPGNLLL